MRYQYLNFNIGSGVSPLSKLNYKVSILMSQESSEVSPQAPQVRTTASALALVCRALAGAGTNAWDIEAEDEGATEPPS